MAIQVLVLGSGQEVGRSCVVVNIGNHTVMFDCGMHMGRRDASKPEWPLNQHHTHQIMTERPGDSESFTRAHIGDCMAKVVAVDLHQTVTVAPGLEFTPYYAGHVLGGAIFHLRAGHESVVYTGGGGCCDSRCSAVCDYNTTPDRHLGQACLPQGLAPDLLITEATYATTLRDSKRGRERAFLAEVQEAVSRGGKVLIPTFAVGRAQELFMMLDDFWERMGLTVPIYFSSAMASRANLHYRLLLSWAHPNLRTPPAPLPPPSTSTSASTSTSQPDGKPANSTPFSQPAPATTATTSPTSTAPTTTASVDTPWLDARYQDDEEDDLDMDPVPDPTDPGCADGSSGGSSGGAGGASESAPQPFSMRRALPWHRSLLAAPGPCVLFASPGMLNAGVSLQAFVAWAGDPKNLLLLPGFQVAGTIGSSLMRGQTRGLQLDGKTKIDVLCKVHVLAFSAHADAKGILQLLQRVAPKAVMLVHGEKQGMRFLKEKIIRDFGVKCWDPPDGWVTTVETEAKDKAIIHVPDSALRLAERDARLHQSLDRYESDPSRQLPCQSPMGPETGPTAPPRDRPGSGGKASSPDARLSQPTPAAAAAGPADASPSTHASARVVAKPHTTHQHPSPSPHMKNPFSSSSSSSSMRNSYTSSSSSSSSSMKNSYTSSSSSSSSSSSRSMKNPYSSSRRSCLWCASYPLPGWTGSCWHQLRSRAPMHWAGWSCAQHHQLSTLSHHRTPPTATRHTHTHTHTHVPCISIPIITMMTQQPPCTPPSGCPPPSSCASGQC
ncbi:MAG: hypothetical protein WDW38_007398 [Sanguina aurantia]